MAHDAQSICFISEQLISELENLLQLSSYTVPSITLFSNIFHRNNQNNLVFKRSGEEIFFRLLNLYKSTKFELNFCQKYADISELLSFVSGADVIKRLSSVDENINVSVNDKECDNVILDVNSKLISEKRIKHVQIFLAARNKQIKLGKLEEKMIELQSKLARNNIASMLKKHAALDMKNFFERKLIDLQKRDDELCRKKEEIKMILQFSESYMQKVKEKETQLFAIKVQISDLKSCIPGLQRKACEHYSTARKEKQNLSTCLNEINCGSGTCQDSRFSLAQDVFRMLQSNLMNKPSSPCFGDELSLFNSACNRLDLKPFSCPMDAFLLRLKELISDADTVVPATNELQHNFTHLNQFYIALKHNLDAGTEVEKRVCIMGLSALKKISLKATEASKKRDALQFIWNAWMEVDENCNVESPVEIN